MVDAQLLSSQVSEETRSILDVGCGYGRLCEPSLDWHSPESVVVGVDLSGAAIRSAHKLFGSSKRDFLRCDAEHLPFKSNLFDAVISMGVVEYIEEPQNIIDELERVVKKPGKILLTTPNKTGLARLFDRILVGLDLSRPSTRFLLARYRTANTLRILLTLRFPNLQVIAYRFVPLQFVRILCVALGKYERLAARLLIFLRYLEAFFARLPRGIYLSWYLMVKIET